VCFTGKPEKVTAAGGKESVNHTDHVELLRKGIPGRGGVWADFGAGEGAFTLALAELIGPEAVIYSIDKDRRALARQAQAMKVRFPDRPAGNLQILNTDFTRPIDLPPLNGLVMANALHFQRDKEPVVRLLKSYLGLNGRMLLIEYNTDSGNAWVPHPLSYPTWEKLAARSGFRSTQLVATYPSRFLREIYSAMSC
jgi:SAM-dependent methyltransferase